MRATRLRKVGGSVIKPQRHRYTLEELLAQCDPNVKMSDEDQQWLDAEPVGGELL